MADRRDARATRLLDPQWHWLQTAAQRLYAELEPGAHAAALSLAVINADGIAVSYGYQFDGQLTRLVITDPIALAAATRDATIDAAPRDEEDPRA